MSQHDLTIDNQGFPAFRADLNNALQALGSTQSGTSAPSPTFANQLWYDTTNNQLKIRNEDNDAWITLLTLDQTGDVVSQLAATIAVLSAGTAGAPALTTSGDTNTGIFFPAADTIAFAEGGAEVMRIDSSGSVGIGTSSPASKLHVQDGALEVNTSSANGAVVRINYNSTDSIRRIQALETGGGNARPLQIHAQDVRFRDDTAERMRIDSSGNVGIGTNSPTANTRLDLVSDNTSQQFVQLIRLKTTNTGDFHPAILFENSRNNISNAMRVNMDSGNTSGTADFKVDIKDSANVFRTKLQIGANGDVRFDAGFGSTALAYGCRAWVNFNGTGTVAIRQSGNVSSITDNGTGDYTVNFTAAMTDGNYAVVGSAARQDNAQPLDLGIAGATPSTSSVRIRTLEDNGVLNDTLYGCVGIFR